MPREKKENAIHPKKRGKWKPKGVFNMQQLPLAIVMDIQLRLSTKTLCNCRSVCKDWLHMISDPKFAELHRLRSPISMLIKTLAPKRAQRKLDLILVEKSAGYPMRIERMTFGPQNSIPSSLPSVKLINSCNGFVCLSESNQDGSFYVCNPLLGQYINIPPPYKGYMCYRTGMDLAGISFSAKTKEYKVMQTSFFRYSTSCTAPRAEIKSCSCCSDESEAMIYTIGTGVWRSLGKPPRGNRIPFNSFLHGALHWIPVSYNCPQLIQSFDFEREEFLALLAPASLNEGIKCDDLKLGVLKGCLFLGVFGNDGKSDIWIMKDYGVQESWTRILTIENLNPRDYYHPYNVYEPTMFLNDVEILLTYNRQYVVLYNQETKCLQHNRIIQTNSRFEQIGYSPCFVSLHHVSNGEEVKRIRDNNKIDTLLGRGSSDGASSSVPPNPKLEKLD